MKTKGVIHGRMQIFHNDHLKYALLAKERCDYLYIGITNPDIEKTLFNKADPKRSSKENNPFTYFERSQMIRRALVEAGVGLEQFETVPFPINVPALIDNYTPSNATYFLTIYDGWGEEKLKVLNDLNLTTEVLFKKEIQDKKISGTQIRNLIINNDSSWKELVPFSVVEYIQENNLERVLRQ